MSTANGFYIGSVLLHTPYAATVMIAGCVQAEACRINRQVQGAGAYLLGYLGYQLMQNSARKTGTELLKSHIMRDFAQIQPMPQGIGYAEQISKLTTPEPEKSLYYQTFKVLMLRIDLTAERAAV